MDDKLGDWRIEAVFPLEQDLPSAFPGGPSHKAGETLLTLSCLVQTDLGENIGFTTPSATAMALNIAINASKIAETLYSTLSYDDVLTPDGLGKMVSIKNNKQLYDFFEQCMIAATFSYQALEVFCNHSIVRKLNEPMVVKRRKTPIALSPMELERQLSTEEKLAQILPKIMSVPTPKGKKIWETFKKLKEARDSTIHLKLRDQHTVDKESLFFQFLNQSAIEFPTAAVEMIKYFLKGKEPRWLDILQY